MFSCFDISLHSAMKMMLNNPTYLYSEGRTVICLFLFICLFPLLIFKHVSIVHRYVVVGYKKMPYFESQSPKQCG